MRSVLLVLISAVVPLLPACDSTDSGTVPPEVTGRFVVEGRVTAGTTAVEGADVRVTHHPDGCTEPPTAQPTTSTDASGQYRLLLELGVSPTPTSCYRVEVRPPEGSSFEAPPPTQFAPEVRLDPPLDTSGVNVELKGE